MNWTITDIETFLTVMEAGSISSAAVRANLSKSVVSKRISDFEAALGVPLFARHAGRITATDNAVALAERLRPALAGLYAATESVGSANATLRGKLSIAAPMSFGIRHMGPIIAGFARVHPELEIFVEYDDQLTDLGRSGFDIGLRIGHLKDSSLMARRLCDDPRAVVASPDYLAMNGQITDVSDLKDHVVIGYQNVRMGEMWPFEANIEPPQFSRITANNGEAIRDMAIGGLGLAFLPNFIVQDAIADGRLVKLLPQLKQDALPISLVWPPVKPMPRKTRLFIDHVASAFANMPQWRAASLENAQGPEHVG